jgi:mRNA-degrading endonuclease RelE of RelBE toxin-antitoxin system
MYKVIVFRSVEKDLEKLPAQIVKKTKTKFDRIDDVDFFVDPRRMTKEEELRLSQIIADHKKKNQSKRKKAA